MYETIKKFLDEGGKCLLIENGKPLGVVLTFEDFNNIKKHPAPTVILADNPELPPVKIPVSDSVVLKTLQEELNPFLNEEILSEFNFEEAASEAGTDFSEGLTLNDLGLEDDIY